MVHRWLTTTKIKKFRFGEETSANDRPGFTHQCDRPRGNFVGRCIPRERRAAPEGRVSSIGLDPVSSSHSGRVGKRYYMISPRVEWRVDWINRRTCITVQVSSKVARQFVSYLVRSSSSNRRKFPSTLNHTNWDFQISQRRLPLKLFEAPGFCRVTSVLTK